MSSKLDYLQKYLSADNSKQLAQVGVKKKKRRKKPKAVRAKSPESTPTRIRRRRALCFVFDPWGGFAP